MTEAQVVICKQATPKLMCIIKLINDNFSN